MSLLSLLSLTPNLRAQDPDRTAEILAALAEHSSIGNADSSVRVAGGTVIPTVDKQTILTFTEDVRARLETMLDTRFRGAAYRILITAEDAPSTITNSPVLRASYFSPSSGRNGAPPIRISITDIEALDPRGLAREITAGYLAMKILIPWESGRGEALARAVPAIPVVPGRFPDWFPAGIARYLDSMTRQSDAEVVIGAWQNALLPPLWFLTSTNPPPSKAVNANLAAFWMSHPERGARLDALCARLASGEQWSAKLFAESLEPPASSPLVADKNFDSWLLNRRDNILTPGTTPYSHAIRAWRALLINPGEDGAPDFVAPGSPLSILILSRNQKWTKECASAKTGKILRLAAGRGDKFHAAAKAYADFFAAVIKNEKDDALQRLLDEAGRLLEDSAE